jgi:hypothetical protein
MSDEFESLNSRIPDFASALANRIAQKESPETAKPTGNFDPHKMMVHKKQEETAPIDPTTIQKWPEESVKKLQDYCQKMGILGFNSGRMHPIAALAMLKSKFGEDFSDVPLEERCPAGHQKLGETGYGPNYPYSQAVHKKTILHG